MSTSNRIEFDKRALALALLVEGNTVNGICRMLRIGKPNLLRFIRETGEACKDWHERHFVNLRVDHLEIDEQWSYVHTHKERLTPEEKATERGKGDAWLWAGICRDSKAIISWDVRVENRDRLTALELVGDSATRIDGSVAITTDGLMFYREGVIRSFGKRATHAVEIKNFDKLSEGKNVTVMKRAVDPLKNTTRDMAWGEPDLSDSTTSHIERFFLTIRQGNKRFARKTLANSKKAANHAASVDIQIFHYNLCRRHETIKRTPAQAIGVADRPWSLEDMVRLAEEYAAAKTEEQFEKAFERMEWIAPAKRQKSFAPGRVKTPWYLDPQSGGPNPPEDERKDGVAYAS